MSLLFNTLIKNNNKYLITLIYYYVINGVFVTCNDDIKGCHYIILTCHIIINSIIQYSI